jgi:hypothetical protein
LATKTAEGMPGATVKSFEVQRSFLYEVRGAAVSQRRAGLFPKGTPQIGDPTKAPDQFGLFAPHIQKLRDAIVPGSGVEGFIP